MVSRQNLARTAVAIKVHVRSSVSCCFRPAEHSRRKNALQVFLCVFLFGNTTSAERLRSARIGCRVVRETDTNHSMSMDVETHAPRHRRPGNPLLNGSDSSRDSAHCQVSSAPTTQRVDRGRLFRKNLTSHPTCRFGMPLNRSSRGTTIHRLGKGRNYRGDHGGDVCSLRTTYAGRRSQSSGSNRFPHRDRGTVDERQTSGGD